MREESSRRAEEKKGGRKKETKRTVVDVGNDALDETDGIGESKTRRTEALSGKAPTHPFRAWFWGKSTITWMVRVASLDAFWSETLLCLSTPSSSLVSAGLLLVYVSAS